MKRHKPKAAETPRDYPVETKGSRIAAEARWETNSLTREERRKLFGEAMITIYGNCPAKVARTRH